MTTDDGCSCRCYCRRLLLQLVVDDDKHFGSIISISISSSSSSRNSSSSSSSRDGGFRIKIYYNIIYIFFLGGEWGCLLLVKGTKVL